MPASATGAGEEPAHINLLLRGQSNMGGLAVLNRWSGSKTLASDVAQLLGFVPGRDKVSIVFDHSPSDGSATAIGGTAFLRDWIEPINGDWRNGWQLDYGSRQLLKAIEQTIAKNTHPTAVVWLHNESDSHVRGGMPAPTVAQWIDGVKWEAALIRAAAGRTAADMPYVFVSAIPYIGSSSANQTIRTAMEILAEDKAFNAVIGARSTDLDQNYDDPARFGGAHNTWQDGVQLAKRLALVIAEKFAHLARPGSPIALANGDIPSVGPRVASATLVPGEPAALTLQLVHDVATGLKPLSEAASLGAGWSVRTPTGTAIGATGVEILSDTMLKITFARPLDSDMKLFFGWGNARSAIGNAPGRGNAVYDDAGLPVWTDPRGVTIALPPPPNRAPTDITLQGRMHFAENAAAGTALGIVAATDPDPGDTPLLRLLDDAGGRILLDGTTGTLSIAPGARFNHATEPQVSILVEARDAGGLALAERFTFAVDQVPRPPPGPAAEIIATNASAYARGAGISFALPFVEPADGGTASATWTNATMGLRWTAADAGVQVTMAAGALEVRLTSGWSSIKGLWVVDDAASLKVAGAGNVMVSGLGSAGQAITIEAVKAGLVRGAGGNDTITITAFSDAPNRPTASGAGDNLFSVFGGAGHDTITAFDWRGWTSFTVDAGSGDDIVVTGNGADTLRGGRGKDLMTGGGGADRFILRAGDGRTGDTITDFNAAEGDVLVFEGVAPASLSWSATSDGVVVRYAGGDTLLLPGAATLDAASIVFA